jgi:putative acetyltransferase
LSASHRGKGLGRTLLEDALRQAEKLGFSVVTLETASVLREAIALYRKYGFEPYASSHLSARCDQAYRKVLGGG